jgi:hypothetical protein
VLVRNVIMSLQLCRLHLWWFCGTVSYATLSMGLDWAVLVICFHCKQFWS